MTRCKFSGRQLTTTVVKPLRRGSAHLTFPAPLRTTLPIPSRAPAHRRRPPFPLRFPSPGLARLSSLGAF